MSIPGARRGQVRGLPGPGRPGGEHDEQMLDLISSPRDIPPGAPPEMYHLARLLDDLTSPAEAGELAGEAVARARFSRAVSPASPSAATRPAVQQRRSLRERRLPLAAALVAAAAGLGSVTAASAGALPSPIQHFAHEVIGAPAPLHDTDGQPLVITSSPAAQGSIGHPREREIPASPVRRMYSPRPISASPSRWSWGSSAGTAGPESPGPHQRPP